MLSPERREEIEWLLTSVKIGGATKQVIRELLAEIDRLRNPEPNDQVQPVIAPQDVPPMTEEEILWFKKWYTQSA